MSALLLVVIASIIAAVSADQYTYGFSPSNPSSIMVSSGVATSGTGTNPSIQWSVTDASDPYAPNGDTVPNSSPAAYVSSVVIVLTQPHTVSPAADGCGSASGYSLGFAVERTSGTSVTVLPAVTKPFTAASTTVYRSVTYGGSSHDLFVLTFSFTSSDLPVTQAGDTIAIIYPGGQGSCAMAQITDASATQEWENSGTATAPYPTTLSSYSATSNTRYLYQFTVTDPSILGDPQFVGLRGQSYQVHGIDGAIYNLISAAEYSLNSRFVFLSKSNGCPIDSKGHKLTACWSHPGSYLGELGLVINGNRIHVISGAHTVGFEAVTVNDRPLHVGDHNDFISYNSTHRLEMAFAGWALTVDNSDMFVNIRSLAYTAPLSQLHTHGLIGQTHNGKVYDSSLKVIEGEVDDYVIEDNQIFGTQFVYSRYQS